MHGLFLSGGMIAAWLRLQSKQGLSDTDKRAHTSSRDTSIAILADLLLNLAVFSHC